MKPPIERGVPSEHLYATEPQGMVRFLRRSLIWQTFRFFVFNFKMLRIVVGGHS